MQTIRVGGVPEHFNLPWHLAIENQLFEKENIKVEWVEYKGGTGQMNKALRNHEVDVCVLLTEGIVKDIAEGNPSKIISKYLNTPLIWGVFSGLNNPIKYYGEIYDKKYAISRFGSGSHLMPYVDALYKEKTLEKDQFVVINNLDGALESLSNLKTDVFYWERYTTKPYVDKGILKSLGEFVTPWPCFVIAATEKAISEKEEALQAMLRVLYFVNHQFMTSIDSVPEVSKRYGQKLEDVNNWFHSTEWSTNDIISFKMLENVVYTLHKSKIIEQKIQANDLCYKLL